MSTNPTTPTLGEAVTQAATDAAADVAATESALQADVAPLWQQARAEYDALAPAAQARIHGLLNDLEAIGTALPNLHTFFGAK